jgi:hypothetical protein
MRQEASHCPQEYIKIGSLLREQLNQLLFITNSEEEANAAHIAGIACVLVKRPESVNESVSTPVVLNSHIPRVTNLHQIKFVETNTAPPCC